MITSTGLMALQSSLKSKGRMVYSMTVLPFAFFYLGYRLRPTHYRFCLSLRQIYRIFKSNKHKTTDMKTLKCIMKGLLLTVTLLLWLLIICGADSLLENNILLVSVGVAAILSLLCRKFITYKDIAKMTFMTPKEYKRNLKEEV